MAKQFILTDGRYSISFRPYGGSIAIEDFDNRGNSMGWPMVKPKEFARSLYRKAIREWGYKPADKIAGR